MILHVTLEKVIFPLWYSIFFLKTVEMILLTFNEFLIYWEVFGLFSSFYVDFYPNMMEKIVYVNLIQSKCFGCCNEINICLSEVQRSGYATHVGL